MLRQSLRIIVGCCLIWAAIHDWSIGWLPFMRLLFGIWFLARVVWDGIVFLASIEDPSQSIE